MRTLPRTRVTARSTSGDKSDRSDKSDNGVWWGRGTDVYGCVRMCTEPCPAGLASPSFLRHLTFYSVPIRTYP